MIPQRQHAVKLEADKPTTPAEAPGRTAAGDAFSALVVQIFRLDGLLLAAGDALAEPAGQTSARWRVLAAVEEKPLTVAQIARRWGLARQSVQRVANVLVEEGLAVYEENPKHRRAQLLALRPEGRAALGTIQAAQREWANRLGAEIGEDELRQASAILGRVLRIVGEQGGRGEGVTR
ncbi:MAG: MarR family winged helix-turn-helix transcriptional regulator [Chloroflexi bacterium]|nr:MarR family winged helix-turn-helix transcriptional regulator [Chloroflexota bacterium]MCI0580732.1 MarR family winged helix-turn-helix transcriptional regulator [Chloroflexota bacterium]MCI0646649.1 MarR family winged helix-turn-helix transcriptional regulator [Chloroflexota bacterium]MCI0728263.1 MarR family winged helix-turn-helix transcriptional regulator [Chloroflexota bacterium]